MAIDVFRQSYIGRSCRQDNLIATRTGEDAACNYSRGLYTTGQSIINPALDRVRLLVEACDNLDGFQIIGALGGGTGSGFGSLLTQRLAVEYPKASRIAHCVMPSPQRFAHCCETTNALMAIGDLLDDSTALNFMDNQAVARLIEFHCGNDEVSKRDINRVMAEIISATTVQSRLNPQHANGGLKGFVDSTRALVSSHAVSPFFAQSSSPDIGDLAKSLFTAETTSLITSSVHLDEKTGKFEPQPFSTGRLFGCNLLMRGSSVTNQALSKVLRAAVDGQKSAFRFTLPPTIRPALLTSPIHRPWIDRNVLPNASTQGYLFTASTDLALAMKTLKSDCEILYAKRGNLFWYVGEGLDGSIYRESLSRLIDELQSWAPASAASPASAAEEQ